MLYKNILKLSGMMLLLLSVAACGKQYANPKVKSAEFLAGKKAIVITDVIHAYQGLIFNGNIPVAGSFSKIDQNYPNKNLRHEYRMDGRGLFGGPYYVLMIDPGVYVLESMHYTLGDTSYFSTVDGLNPGREDFAYGGFVVKSGEIVYLGDINVNMSDSTSNMLKVYDEFPKAEHYFRKQYPELSHYPIKKGFVKGRGTPLSTCINAAE